MRKIVLNGEYMTMNEAGHIGRPGLCNPTAQWRVTGAVQYQRGRIVRSFTVREIYESPESIPWKTPKGRQQVFICDNDHGTDRQWWEPHHVF